MLDAGELELVARAQAGDVDAIGALYDRHQHSIFKYLWLRLGDRQAAEDLTGDVFLRMLDALPNYRPTGLPFRAWLYRIAHNRLVDHYRGQAGRTQVSLEAVTLHADGDDPASATDHNLLVEQLARALSSLDDNQRDVIVLRFVNGLSLRETAIALDKTEAAVKSMQHRSLAALRAFLHPTIEKVIE